MRIRTIWLALLLAALTTAGASAQPAAGPANHPPPKDLTDDEMTRYVAALDDMVALGVDAEKELGTSASDTRQAMVSLAYSEKAQQIIEAHAFTPESFATVHWNAMAAYASLEMQGHQAEMETARKQQAAAMESLRGQMSPEQHQQMMQSMAGAQTMMKAYQDVPPGNLALVRKHRKQLEMILKRQP
jgi:hypothetical protein